MLDYKINPLITEYMHWVEHQMEKAKNTVDNYKADLILFENFMLDKEVSLLEVTKKDIEDYLLYMKDIRKWANSTRTRRLVSVRNFYQYLYDEEYITVVPTDRVKLPPTQERNPVYLTQKQAIKIINATETQEEPYKSRDKLIIMLFLTTGLRAEELTNIKISDITENTLSVIGKGNKEREVGLNDDVLQVLKNYLKIRNSKLDHLFISNRGTGMSKRTIQYTVDKYIRLAKLDTNKFSTHKMRHSAAVFMHKGGMDIRTIQQVLGHSQVQTTEIYTHVDNEQIQKAANVTNGMFK